MSTVSARRERIGTGEIVPREYGSMVAMRRFFEVLWELNPEAEREYYSLPFDDRQWLVYDDFSAWQERHRLAIRSLYERCSLGFDYAGLHAEGLGRAPDRITGLFEPCEHTFHQQRVRFAFEIGFDPRTETIDGKVKSITPGVTWQIQSRLERIVEREKNRDSHGEQLISTPDLPARQHFEWTVRYQCLGESFGKITRDEGLSNENNWVSEKVREIAELIGLTLREPDKGGRPRKQPPARNSRCIAIPHKRENPCPEQ